MKAKPSQQGVASTDLSNRSLISILAGALSASIFAIIITASLTGIWGLPGGPLLQAAAAIGAVCLVGSFVAVLAKRRGRPGKAGFRVTHLACQHRHRASLGPWGERAAKTARHAVYASAAAHRPWRLVQATRCTDDGADLWRKARRLRQAEPGSAGRSLPASLSRSRHCWPSLIRVRMRLSSHHNSDIGSARRSWHCAIRSLQRKKAASSVLLLACRKIQARWRVVHRLAALAFVGGLLAHIIIVMLFAGYAADGGDIYWLHFAAWDF